MANRLFRRSPPPTTTDNNNKKRSPSLFSSFFASKSNNKESLSSSTENINHDTDAVAFVTPEKNVATKVTTSRPDSPTLELNYDDLEKALMKNVSTSTDDETDSDPLEPIPLNCYVPPYATTTNTNNYNNPMMPMPYLYNTNTANNNVFSRPYTPPPFYSSACPSSVAIPSSTSSCTYDLPAPLFTQQSCYAYTANNSNYNTTHYPSFMPDPTIMKRQRCGSWISNFQAPSIMKNENNGLVDLTTSTKNIIRKPLRSKAQPRPCISVPPRGIGPVHEPNENDVLCGRGGRVNAFIGNIQFRKIASTRKKDYLDENTKKLQKAHIAADIVNEIRKLGGRFLKYDEKDYAWYDIGDKRAIKKVGQALREDAAETKTTCGGDGNCQSTPSVTTSAPDMINSNTNDVTMKPDVIGSDNQDDNDRFNDEQITETESKTMPGPGDAGKHNEDSNSHVTSNRTDDVTKNGSNVSSLRLSLQESLPVPEDVVSGSVEELSSLLTACEKSVTENVRMGLANPSYDKYDYDKQHETDPTTTSNKFKIVEVSTRNELLVSGLTAVDPDLLQEMENDIISWMGDDVHQDDLSFGISSNNNNDDDASAFQTTTTPLQLNYLVTPCVNNNNNNHYSPQQQYFVNNDYPSFPMVDNGDETISIYSQDMQSLVTSPSSASDSIMSHLSDTFQGLDLGYLTTDNASLAKKLSTTTKTTAILTRKTSYDFAPRNANFYY